MIMFELGSFILACAGTDEVNVNILLRRNTCFHEADYDERVAPIRILQAVAWNDPSLRDPTTVDDS